MPLKCYQLAGWGRALLAQLSDELNIWLRAWSPVTVHGRMCFESPVKAGSGAANLPQGQCLAVLAQLCVIAISLRGFPS